MTTEHQINIPRGCCETDEAEPMVKNRPGQSALDYRIGTHGSFMRRMLTRLARQEIPSGDRKGERPLARLTTRAPDDPAIALLDAWATVADVLTFYQERIANEGYLRTATERRSVLELARAIGYELNPGVAASTYLAFTLDNNESSPDVVTIPAGTPVQSIPAKEGELPQTFETSTEIKARPEWNEIKARTTEPHEPADGVTEVYLKGTATRLQPGDAILFVGDERDAEPGSERWDLRILRTVERFPEAGYTRATWLPGLGHDKPTVRPADTPRVFAFRQKAALFGHNAPDWRTMPDNVKMMYDADWDPDNPDRRKTQWPNFKIQTANEFRIDLDNTYPKVLAGSWVVLTRPGYTALYKVVEAVTDSRTDYAITAQVTRLELDTREHLSWFGLRDTTVYLQTEELARAERPIAEKIEGNRIDLNGRITVLQPDQPIVVSGKVDRDAEETVSEVAFVEFISDNKSFTTVNLQEDLQHAYVRDTVTVNANVVHATHGETSANEVLGGGDGASANQRFTLTHSPLTFVAASTAGGVESTLEVRVNGVRWNPADSLYARGPEEKLYVVRIDNDAKASVIFGDGEHGARLPTGTENVRATYRHGIGRGGEVAAKSLTLLKRRPFGVRGVTNPVAADGAADPEKLENARTNAPLTVLTLDRIVSLRDFEDFARAFAGIGKASAVSIWNGETDLVHITVADDQGEPVPDETLGKLIEAIDNARDPIVDLMPGVIVENYAPVFFHMEATVLFDAACIAERVQAEIEAELREFFAFDKRAFGQPVTAAEIIGIIHRVKGVVAVDLDALYARAETGAPILSPRPPLRIRPVSGIPALGDFQRPEISLPGRPDLSRPPLGQGALRQRTSPEAVLPAQSARRSGEEILPAQLLLLDESGIHLTMNKR